MELLVEMEWKLEKLRHKLLVNGFNVDRDKGFTIMQMYINIQKSDMEGGNMPWEIDTILLSHLWNWLT